jgi:hypothetical protein
VEAQGGFAARPGHGAPGAATPIVEHDPVLISMAGYVQPLDEVIPLCVSPVRAPSVRPGVI